MSRVDLPERFRLLSNYFGLSYNEDDDDESMKLVFSHSYSLNLRLTKLPVRQERDDCMNTALVDQLKTFV